jgi:hypothetical protein
MDSHNLVSLPIKVVLLIAEQLANCHHVKCRDVLNLMQVCLPPKGYSRDTACRFQKIMFRISARQMILHSNEARFALLPPTCWTIAAGDVELTQIALGEYQAYHDGLTLDRLLPYEDRWDGSTRRVVKLNLSRFPGRMNPGTIRNPTPIMLAVLSGNINMLKYVLGMRTALTAPLVTRVDMVRHTIVQAKDSLFYVSALSLAAQMGRLDMVKLLVEAGAQVNWTRDRARDHVRDPECEDPSILGSICGWGAGESIDISERQRAGQRNVLGYFLEMGHPIDETGYLASWTHCNSQGPDTCPCSDPTTRVYRVPRTPLWHAIWFLNPKCLPHAVFLIRHGAKWAPWTAWQNAPWPRERIHDPGWRSSSWRQPRSPLEWVLCGGESRLCTGRKTVPDAAEIEIEETLFMTMMEEGVERPTTPRQPQFALETVIHAHSKRSFRFHPRVNSLFHRRVRYLLDKGASVRGLNDNFARALREL